MPSDVAIRRERINSADCGALRRRGLVWICLLVLASASGFGRAQQSGAAAGHKSLLQPVGDGPRLQTRLVTTVRQVHDLTPEEAAGHVPAKLKGVVTAFSGWRDYFFFQDATGGIAVNRDEHGPLRAGDEVELTGVSDPGLFSTSIISRQLRVIRPGAMPVARLYTYSELEGGAKDADWVQVRGVVHSAQVESIWGRAVLVLKIEIGGGPISVRIFDFSPGDALRFVDAEVRVAGACGTVYNDKRQFTGLRLFVAESSAVRVELPAPADPFAGVATPVRGVMQVAPEKRTGHRVKIEGVATYQNRGHFLYVQNGVDGILIATDQDQAVATGTRIEAVGFPALGDYSPILTDASFRTAGSDDSVVPLPIRAASFLQYKDTFAYAPYDGQLVRLQGTVVSPLALPNEDAWLMRDGDHDFTISLRRGANGSPLTGIANGSTMSVTGVMVVTADPDHQPQAFRILLRSPLDLVVVRGAPWWTPLHSLVMLGLLVLASVAGVLWTMLLRRQVQRQTRLLKESERRFRSMAQQDALTCVASRAFLHEQLEAAVRDARATGKMVGLLMLDLDHFKQLNDTQGHLAGDQLLCIVAHRIRATVRKGDIVARMGGDEFVVLLNDIGDESMAATIGAKVVTNVAVPAEIGTMQITVSASVGVCIYPAGGADAQTLLKNADEAMYQAKARGRNSSCVYTAA